MTESSESAFDRALAREHELRARRERVAWARRSSHTGTLQVLAMLVIPMPLHLWLVDWERTTGVVVHVVAITVFAVIAALTWLAQRDPLPPEEI